MRKMTREAFGVRFGSAKLRGDIVSNGGRISVLFLHGAGNSQRSRFDPLRTFLAGQGIGSCAIDFIGHGETGGDMHSSSLKSRVEQVVAVIRALGLAEPLSLVGSSMGGYTAMKLTELFKVDNLIFFVPAAYDKEAYTVPFGEKFSVAIRAKLPDGRMSWERSDAWDILSAFRGSLLLFAGEQDDVVPPQVTQKIFDSADKARSKEKVLLSCGHFVGKYLSSHPEAQALVNHKILNMLKTGNLDT